MKDKKLEQSIIGVALVLLLCGYYTAPHTTVSNKVENTEESINIPLRGAENREPHIKEALCGTGLDENEVCRFEIAKTDSIF
jgi:hypothetical protein